MRDVHTMWRNLILAIAVAATTSCTTTSSDTTTSSTESSTTTNTIGAILYVERDRADVGDSDDFISHVVEIERVSPDASACIHLHRTTPEGGTIAFLALLSEQPDEVGVDYFRIGGMTVRSGDTIRGDFELGSAERPQHLAQAHSEARTQLIEACAPLNLDQRFDQVFDTAPIIFIEHVEPQQ